MPVTIAHLSDLHFGMANQSRVWELLVKHLAKVKPNLVLVTGDLADSAQENELEAAANGLAMLKTYGLKCYVCAGNHDRHLQGNAVQGALGALVKVGVRIYTKTVSPKERGSGVAGGQVNTSRFDKLFNDLGMLAPIGSPLDIPLPSEGDARWRIRLLALDSSTEAKYAAQGFVTPKMLSTIRDAASTKGVDDERAPDLVVVLLHHHLLPVSSLEAADRQSVSGVFASTVLVNAGTVLETLVDVGADLVLHGHEHARHLARYGSLADGRTELAVIGAASATGANTNKGCETENSSFNIIQLGDDLSVTLFEQRYGNGTWESFGGGRQLMGAVDIRRARYLRKQGPGRLPSSRVLKQFTYTPWRNAVIRQVTTNCVVERQRFSVETANASGTPYFMGGFVEMPTGGIIPLHQSDVPMRPKNGGSYEHVQLLDGLDRERAVVRRIEHEIAWLAGGVLTTDDLSRCGLGGEIRDQGREFVEMEVLESLESLTLAIELPHGLGPRARSDVEVLVRQRKSTGVASRPELTERLRFSGLNRIAVNIPFPMAGYSYLVAWKLPDIPAVDPGLADVYARMSSLAREAAFDIVANLAKLASELGFAVGIYVPETGANGLAFRLVGHSAEGLPTYVSLHSNQHPFCSAYWGVPKIVLVENPGKPTAEEAGFGVQSSEAGMILLPLPTLLGGTTSPGIARISWPVQDARKEVDRLLLRAVAAVQGCASRLFDLVR